MSLVLTGDGVGYGCSKHGTYAFHSACEECVRLSNEEPKYAAKHFESRICRGCCYGSHCLGADPDCVCCKAQ